MAPFRQENVPFAARPEPTANAPVANSPGPVALVGKWGTGIAGDTVSGNYIQYGSVASQKYYQFNADGTYSFIYSGYSGLAGTAGAFLITIEENGVFTFYRDCVTINTHKKKKKNKKQRTQKKKI